MSNLQLTYNEITLDYFVDFFENNDYKKIGIQLSSGTDSALILYFLAKFITETESFDKVIYPWIGIEENNILSKVRGNIPKIIDVIKTLFPKVKIEEPHLEIWTRVAPYENNKRHYMMTLGQKFKKDNKLDIYLSGATANPPKEIIESENMESGFDKAPEYRHVDNLNNKDMTDGIILNIKSFPFITVDKKFISHQYEKFDLMQNLYLVTESCVTETLENSGKNEYPCKQCFWCKERYWAFGSYDGGVQ